ncbi:glycosyltransferase family 4 protein [Inquilinus limosus]|uniref:glycosyltransferase family 4 protein n=1 Tax=Inquilinus limosus TaxID=171674 RepID=UPI003F14D44E
MTNLLSYVRGYTTVTGVQRVLLSVVGHLVATHGADVVRGIAWHPKRRRVVEIDLSFLDPAYRFDVRAQEFARDMDILIASKARGAFTWLRTKARRQRWKLFGLPGYGRQLREPSLMPDDRILLMVPIFRSDPYLDFLAKRKAAGNRIFQMIHDVMPLTMPWLSYPGRGGEFRKFLDRTPNYVSDFLCVSNQTEADLKAVLGPATIIPSRVTPLAHEFLGAQGSEAALSSAVRAAAEFPFVLYVGTIELRKNALSLCKVWARLRDDLGVALPRLVLAGRRGWQSEDVFDLLRGTGNLGGYATVIEAPTDADLGFLYSRCAFTVYPSLYEGWGLPIGESLWFGKYCVASRTSSMPEVGGELVDYVDPRDLEDIRRVLMRALTDPAYIEMRMKKIQEASLRRWSDVAEEIFDAVA